ncbi:MAG: YabP/YqfC family sporulation protein [bacterium]|nr:YabP/YqfC family sporulation protein [bacterium]
MNIKNAIINFLYDNNYFISFFKDSIYIYNYERIINLSENKITLKIENFTIDIIGNNLKITQMNNIELLIEGNIKNIGKK